MDDFWSHTEGEQLNAFRDRVELSEVCTDEQADILLEQQQRNTNTFVYKVLLFSFAVASLFLHEQVTRPTGMFVPKPDWKSEYDIVGDQQPDLIYHYKDRSNIVFEKRTFAGFDYHTRKF